MTVANGCTESEALVAAAQWPLLPALKNLSDDDAKGAEKKREEHP